MPWETRNTMISRKILIIELFALLWHLHYCGSLELNLHNLWGLPVLNKRPCVNTVTHTHTFDGIDPRMLVLLQVVSLLFPGLRSLALWWLPRVPAANGRTPVGRGAVFPAPCLLCLSWGQPHAGPWWRRFPPFSLQAGPGVGTASLALSTWESLLLFPPFSFHNSGELSIQDIGQLSFCVYMS